MCWIVLMLLVGGCSHTTVNAISDPANGVARIKVHGHSSALAGLLVGGWLIAGAVEELEDPRPFPSLSAAFDMSPPLRYELDPHRNVSEQDCSARIDIPQGNLRCR